MNRAEKICFLSELIFYLKKNNTSVLDGYELLLQLSHIMHISPSDYKYLVNHPVNYTNLKPYEDRYLKFYRLVSYVLNDQTDDTFFNLIETIYNIGLKMGLNYDAVNRIIDLSVDFKYKKSPVQLIYNIARVYYN